MASTPLRYCIIGAGPCGLAAAKNFLERGHQVDVIDRNDRVGGNWNFESPHSSVYESAHLISSKTLTQYFDFPMPEDYPAFPSRKQVAQYLEAYSQKFQLHNHIRFGSTVLSAQSFGESGWKMTLGDGTISTYDGLIVANGHHSDPVTPLISGEFFGESFHSHVYKSPDIFRGKRVLVVGAGNSGCDIAAEAARTAQATFISLRRGYHFLPKFLRGKPIDLCGERLHRWKLPLSVRRFIASIMVRLAVGTPQRYGLPAPDHKLFETHPIVNSQLLYELGHGRLSVKPNIAELRGDRVAFIDGSEEPIDLIVFATGYRLSFPFLNEREILDSHGRPILYLNAFHPRRNDFFVSGLIQPDSGIWGLADLQTRIMAHYVRTLRESPEKAAWFEREKSRGANDLGGGVRYVDTPRHALEVEYFSYRERLLNILKRFGETVVVPKS